ncbi:MAG: DUF4160 domain-containing protein [Phycisphaeraceae bacterium]
MPEICRFFGIVITMYYNDHAPPHFHVRYGNQRATVSIEGLRILEGTLSPRVMGMVIEWAALRRQDLRRDWELARQRSPLRRITPLE